jgi:hypothetical protein
LFCSWYVAQAGLKLATLLPQPLEYWDRGVYHYVQLTNNLKEKVRKTKKKANQEKHNTEEQKHIQINSCKDVKFSAR